MLHLFKFDLKLIVISILSHKLTQKCTYIFFPNYFFVFENFDYCLSYGHLSNFQHWGLVDKVSSYSLRGQ